MGGCPQNAEDGILFLQVCTLKGCRACVLVGNTLAKKKQEKRKDGATARPVTAGGPCVSLLYYVFLNYNIFPSIIGIRMRVGIFKTRTNGSLYLCVNDALCP